MDTKLSYLINNQVPEHLREFFPLFVGFMELYYQYSEQRTNALGMIVNHHQNIDIDSTLDGYITKFYSQYGKFIPVAVSLDRRELIKLLNEIYSAKGTEKSFKALFRTLFNSDVQISYPSESLLKPSDGTWVQENFITVELLYGSIENAINKTIRIDNYDILDINSQHDEYYINPTRYEYVGGNNYRLYFSSNSYIQIRLGVVMNVYDNTTLAFSGVVGLSPSGYEIIDSGNKFHVGQIFEIPGTQKSGYIKITRVLPASGSLVDGRIAGIEPLSYGWTYSDDQTFTLSPYKTAPPAGEVTINLVGSTYTVTVNDVVSSISEVITGYENGFITDYFVADYVAVDYVMDTIMSMSFGGSSGVSFLPQSSLTLQQYYDYQAVIKIKYDVISKMPGYFTDDKGTLSNPFIVLQDSYYYQIFSYVIESDIDITQYRDSILKICHPAGMIAFATTSKLDSFDLTPSILLEIN